MHRLGLNSLCVHYNGAYEINHIKWQIQDAGCARIENNRNHDLIFACPSPITLWGIIKEVCSYSLF